MNKTSKIIIGVVVLVIIVGLVFVFEGEKKEEEIRIGFMTDLSGPASAYGLEIQRGAQLAIDDIKKQNEDIKLDVIFEDDKCSGLEGATIANKFINIDKLKVTGGTVCSTVAMSIAPIMEENKVIHLATGASSPELSEAGDYIFRVWPSDDFEAIVLAEHVSSKLNIKNIGILCVNSEFAGPLKDAFSQKFKEKGGNILGLETYNVNEKDFKTQLSKLTTKNIEAIYLITNPPELPIILKQIKELNFEGDILSYGPAVQAEGVIDSAKENIEGLYYAHPDQRDSEWFRQQYSSFYDAQPGLGAGVGYDTLMLLYKASSKCGSDDSKCVKEFLYNIKNYAGASGKISFDENGDVFIPAVIKQIKNGKPVVIQ